MAIQTSYSYYMQPGYIGEIVDQINKTLISRTVEDADGLPFGVPAMQGVNDFGCRASKAGDTAEMFVGITTRVRSVRAGENAYGFEESARIMTIGAVYVEASVQVKARDPVYFVLETGAWTNTDAGDGTTVKVSNAQFDTSTDAANQIAQIRMG